MSFRIKLQHWRWGLGRFGVGVVVLTPVGIVRAGVASISTAQPPRELPSAVVQEPLSSSSFAFAALSTLRPVFHLFILCPCSTRRHPPCCVVDPSSLARAFTPGT